MKTLFSKEYSLENYHRSNQDTCMLQRPSVSEGDWVQSGDLLADSSASQSGEITLGKNILIAYMPWEGYNYEDAILIGERLVSDDLYTSIHIEKYETEVRENKSGTEKITKDIPDLGKKELSNLDRRGIIKKGSWVEEGDILVGKITPIPKKSQPAYQKLLYNILEKKFFAVRDTSLRAPKGLKAKVIEIQVLYNSSLIQKKVSNKIPLNNSLGVQKHRQETKVVKLLPTPKKGMTRYNRIPARKQTIHTSHTSKISKANRNTELVKKKGFFNFSSLTNCPYFFNRYSILRKYNVQQKNNLHCAPQHKLDNLHTMEKLWRFKNLPISNGWKQRNISVLQRRQKLELRSTSPITEKKLRKSGNYSMQQIKTTETKIFVITLGKKRGSHKKNNIYGLNSALLKKIAKKGCMSLRHKLKNGENNNYKIKMESQTKKFERAADSLLKNHPLKKLNNLNAISKTPSKKTWMKGEQVPQFVQIYLADKRRIQVGDKMAGRHGNKGIISQILPRQDMPYLPNGTSIDMVLNPLGVPSRMNVGQIYECLLGLAGKYLGEFFRVTPFDEIYGAEASRSLAYSKLYEARQKTGNSWLFHPRHPGKMKIFDGRTGESFDQAVTVGIAYMLKLVHLVDDKIHCLTSDHDVLTKQGWIPISEVKTSNTVASLNAENQLVYINPTKLWHYYNYSGKLYHIKNQQIDLSVTLNHRMWISTVYDQKNWSNYNLIEAAQLIGKHVKYLKSANWIQSDYQFSLPNSDVVFPMTPWLIFFGLWINNGWTQTTKTKLRGALVCSPPVQDLATLYKEQSSATCLHYSYNITSVTNDASVLAPLSLCESGTLASLSHSESKRSEKAKQQGAKTTCKKGYNRTTEIETGAILLTHINPKVRKIIENLLQTLGLNYRISHENYIITYQPLYQYLKKYSFVAIEPISSKLIDMVGTEISPSNGLKNKFIQQSDSRHTLIFGQRTRFAYSLLAPLALQSTRSEQCKRSTCIARIATQVKRVRSKQEASKERVIRSSQLARRQDLKNQNFAQIKKKLEQPVFIYKSYNQSLPDWVWQCSQEQCQFLLHGLVIGNSSFLKTTSYYTTSSLQLADEIMRLALHAGWSANISFHSKVDQKTSVLKNKQGIKKHDFYNVSIQKTKNNPSVNGSNSQTQQLQKEFVSHFQGPVYCLEVPHGIFMVRKGGKAVWTGNSRSTGPYSLVTQQPLRGRSKQGGQRLGEMEVWALEGYGAAFVLLEMLTIKSDDISGRMALWSNIILDKEIYIGTPESFKVLVCELQALCLDIGIFRLDQNGVKRQIDQLIKLS